MRNGSEAPDPILRSGYFGALLLSAVIGGLSVFGLIQHPHWIWPAPIATAILAIIMNQRMRYTESHGAALLYATATLVCLVGAGLLAGMAVRIAH